MISRTKSAAPARATPVLRPLVQIVNGEGVPVACPLLEIDRLRGRRGGRDDGSSNPPMQNSMRQRSRIVLQERSKELQKSKPCRFIHASKRMRFRQSGLTNSGRSPMKAIDNSSRVGIVVLNSAGTPVFNSSGGTDRYKEVHDREKFKSELAYPFSPVSTQRR